ncbi:tRNA lysidine(34) synthetase TilS [Paenibacillus sp. UNC451MF]|uniref:tRNA lysidine(34) synthetase TilS n=1 Tax=Paenibacillus sp. UNC451MF TaxID=1449063 RepID=UPI0005621CFF|nr:tRNA lysidine(34) synthetase TilS [Paenibacillus sp. UNC451MF]
MDLVSRVEKQLHDEQLLRQGDSIVAAVSGGPDSIAMLHVLFLLSERWGWRLVVAHVNHQFRVEESEQEASFVEEYSRQLGIPCEIARIDVPQYIRESGKNSQAAARELRYRFLHETADKYGAKRIALAHHADDQAETLLMRLLRGTGPSGLTGIPMRRVEHNVELVRPLLRIYKSELLDYCHHHQLTYYIDSSNNNTKYFRNEIRLELLPLLQERYNEQLPQALNRLSVMMTAEDDFLDKQASTVFEQNVAVESDFAQWSRNWFAGVHVALQRRLIKLILNYLSFEADSLDFMKLEQMRELIIKEEPSNLRIDIGHNLSLTREYDRIKLHTYVVPPEAYLYILQPRQESLTIVETGAVIECSWSEEDTRMKEGATDGAVSVWFDADLLAFPLTVRSRADGDKMNLFGLNGSKKVKDIFIDAKIPPSLRARIPVITDADNRVIWLPGVRRSSWAPVNGNTKAWLHMKLCMEEGLLSTVLR